MQSSRLRIGIGIAVVVLGILAAAWYFYGTRTSYTPPVDVSTSPIVPESIELVDVDMRTALRSGNIDAAINAPAPETLATETTADAQRLFNLAQEQHSFGRTAEALAYLVPLLDSNSPSFTPFKSIGAYLFIRVADDAGKGAAFLAESIARSSYMSALTPRASKVFPRVFETLPSVTDIHDTTLYRTAYLIALSEVSNDTIAVPANVALELLRLYAAPTATTVEKNIYAPYIRSSIQTAKRVSRDRFESAAPSSAYDTVSGLNALAIGADIMTHYSLADFKDIPKADVLQLLDLSRVVAQQRVPSLTSFTSYLNALYGARYLDATQERNTKRINTFMQNILGPAPFEKLNEHSWAMKYIANAKSGSYMNYYARENIVLIASRSEILREFLKLKAGWTDADFATSTKP